jgi:hypothetical protein
MYNPVPSAIFGGVTVQLYVFSSVNRQLAGIVESFEYLRWTRRYSGCGSFELKAVGTAENIALLKEGNIIWKNDDDEAGIIEHLELSQTDTTVITASGRFATSLLARRIVRQTAKLSGDVSTCVGTLIQDNLISPADADRAIGGVAFSSPNFGIAVKTQISYRNLLEAVAGLCDAVGVGIKTVFAPQSGLFTVTLYSAPPLQAVFSKEYENLTGQVYTESTADYANSALIGGEGEGAERVFVTIDGGSGEARRELFIDAKDLRQEDFPNDYADALLFRGQSALSELAPRYTFDAEVNPHGNLAYKTDFDVGQVVKVISKAWGVTQTARITEIEETYDASGLSLAVTFGKSELTLAQKIRSDVASLETALQAETSGGAQIETDPVFSASPAAGITSGNITSWSAKYAKPSGGIPTADLADGAVTMAKLNTGALPAANNTVGQRLWTGTYTSQSGATVDLNTYTTEGDYALFSVGTATNFPEGTWAGKSCHLRVERFYSYTMLRQTISREGDAAMYYTRISTSSTAWTAWQQVLTGTIGASQIANGAVTIAKTAPEADTAMTYTAGSGVTVAVNTSMKVRGVCYVTMTINVTSAIAVNSTVLTITDTNFTPYAQVGLYALKSGAESMAGCVFTTGRIIRNTGAALSTGYWIVNFTYPSAA